MIAHPIQRLIQPRQTLIGIVDGRLMRRLGILRLLDDVQDSLPNTLFKIQRGQLLFNIPNLTERGLCALCPVGFPGLVAILDGLVVLPIGIGELLIGLLNLFEFRLSRAVGRVQLLLLGSLGSGIPGGHRRFLSGQVDLLGARDGLLIELGNQLLIRIDQPFGVSDLSIQIVRSGRSIIYLQALCLQRIDLLQIPDLFLVQFIGIPNILCQRGVSCQRLREQLPILIDLRDGSAQLVISLSGLRQGAVSRLLLGGGKECLNLRHGWLERPRHLLAGLPHLLRGILDFILEPRQHLPNLLFNHIAHVQVYAGADGSQQRIGLADIALEPCQVEILCADQLILTLSHALTTSSHKESGIAVNQQSRHAHFDSMRHTRLHSGSARSSYPHRPSITPRLHPSVSERTRSGEALSPHPPYPDCTPCGFFRPAQE